MKAVNIKEKLANVRETCRGYSEYTYRFVDYVAESLGDLCSPSRLGLEVSLCLIDIQCGCYEDDSELPGYFIANKDKILDVAWQFLQVIDVVVGGEFAEEFRKFCWEEFAWSALRRFTVTDDQDYPKYIKVALDWWCGVIQAGKEPTCKYDDDGHEIFYKQLTVEEIKTFRKALAKGLMEAMDEGGAAMIVIEHGIAPCSFEADLALVGLSDKNMPPIHHSICQEHLQMDIFKEYVLLWQDHVPVYLWKEKEG